MRRRGKSVETVVIPDSGHVELIAPGAQAWTRARSTLDVLLAGLVR
jgi:hypothetical protein